MVTYASINYKNSTEWLDELEHLSHLKFTLYTHMYECSLTRLYIDEALTWLNKYNLNGKSKQIKRFNDLSRWVQLAKEYRSIVNLFYPSNLTRINTFLKEIKESGYSYTYSKESIQEYWAYKLSSINLDLISLNNLIDYGRVARKLNLINKFNVQDFSEVFDLESNHGYSMRQIELFYSLIAYLRESSINKYTWTYSKYEWPLLSQSVKLWQSWQRCSSVGLDRATYLLNKFLGIKDIHPLFIDWIWIIPHKEIDMYTQWYLETEGTHIEDTKSINSLVLYSFQVLNLEPNSSFTEIKTRYKELIKLYHPDVNNGTSTKAKEINEAWSILKQYYNK